MADASMLHPLRLLRRPRTGFGAAAAIILLLAALAFLSGGAKKGSNWRLEGYDWNTTDLKETLYFSTRETIGAETSFTVDCLEPACQG
jgi:hypothetical protein